MPGRPATTSTPQHIENLTDVDLAALRRKPYATSSVRLVDYLETWQTGEFLRALDWRPDDRPWLAACSFNAPHFPLIVSEPYDTIIDRSLAQLPTSLAAGPGTTPREVRESHYATEFADLTEQDWIECIAHDLGLCAMVDAEVGRIVEHLKAMGEWDNTIVVYTSDHSDLMGAHGLMQKGHLLHYEEDLRVPLIVRHPDVEPSRVDDLVSVCDVSSRWAELAGVPQTGAQDGISFAGMLGRSDSSPTRAYVTAETTLADGHAGGHGEPFRASDWQYPRDSLNLSIRTPELRYVFRSDDEDELYDLRTDPDEITNLATDPVYAAQRTDLRRALADEIGDRFAPTAYRPRGPR